jgi:hypothetical protein
MLFFFWVITPCKLVGRYQRFGEIYWLSPALKTESGCFSKTLVSTYESTQRHNPEGQHNFSANVFRNEMLIYVFPFTDSVMINANRLTFMKLDTNSLLLLTTPSPYILIPNNLNTEVVQTREPEITITLFKVRICEEHATFSDVTCLRKWKITWRPHEIQCCDDINRSIIATCHAFVWGHASGITTYEVLWT